MFDKWVQSVSLSVHCTHTFYKISHLEASGERHCLVDKHYLQVFVPGSQLGVGYEQSPSEIQFTHVFVEGLQAFLFPDLLAQSSELKHSTHFSVLILHLLFSGSNVHYEDYTHSMHLPFSHLPKFKWVH